MMPVWIHIGFNPFTKGCWFQLKKVSQRRMLSDGIVGFIDAHTQLFIYVQNIPSVVVISMNL
jgi:hypothetical protein